MEMCRAVPWSKLRDIFVKPFATEIQNDDGMIIAKTGFVFFMYFDHAAYIV